MILGSHPAPEDALTPPPKAAYHPLMVEGTSEKTLETPVRMEFVESDGAISETTDATLFIDPKTDRLGVKAPEGEKSKDDSRFQVPLSEVIDLIRKGGL